MSRSNHILIADDSRQIREAVTLILNERISNVEVTEAVNGAQALQLMDARLPDLVLCDYEMPIFNGLQTLQAIRKRWSAIELPVLMLTGHTSISDKVAAFQLGANDYVTKPAHPTELSARVQAHLDLKFLVEENARARDQLINAHRLQGVGRLAAGLAHEINTPAQYISDNQQFLRKAMSGFREVLEHIRGWSTGEPLVPDAAARVQELWKQRRLDYLLDETPHALDQCTEGINRIVQLVNDLKTFTDQPTDKALQPASLNGAIENTLAVSRSEWDELATLSLNLDPTLPEIPCKLPELRHALLNIIDNSVHAFRGDFGGELRPGTIEIVSRRVEGGAEVVISDNGPGIKAAIRPHVFDPFFTTKEVGRGSGQGLAIGYNVIVNQHGGRLICEDSETGGARFRLWLPLERTDPT